MEIPCILIMGSIVFQGNPK